VPGGQSARLRRSVRIQYFPWNSLPSSFVFLFWFASIRLRFGFLLQAVFGQSATEARTVRGQADSPRAPGGQSDFPGFVTGGSAAYLGPSAAQGRTVRRVCADSSPLLAGQSSPGRQICLFDSIPFLLPSCFHVCFKESFLRLRVDP
jgi:hypothetical protein